jgi:kynurenine formamidase
MCDLHPRNRLGWRGWPKLPKMVTGEAAGAWHDLSHRLHEGLPVPHVFPEPKIERVMSMPEGRLNVTKIELACHVGTHLDAPVHLLMDGPGFDEIPLEMLHGPGVVWSIDAEPFAEIGTDRWGTDSYLSNPALSTEAAEWLVSRRIKALGVDFATPDAALPRRGLDFDWPVHQILLSNGVLIAENLTGLAPLAGSRVEVVFGALNIEGGDGSPARIMARRVRS